MRARVSKRGAYTIDKRVDNMGGVLSSLGSLFSWIPGVGNCIQNALDDASGGGPQKLKVLNRMALPLSVAVGAICGVWGVMTYGPMPSVLIGAAVLVGITYVVIKGIICKVNKHEMFTCLLGGILKSIKNIIPGLNIQFCKDDRSD